MENTEKALHVERKKPRNTPNTLKEGLRKSLPAWGSPRKTRNTRKKTVCGEGQSGEI